MVGKRRNFIVYLHQTSRLFNHESDTWLTYKINYFRSSQLKRGCRRGSFLRLKLSGPVTLQEENPYCSTLLVPFLLSSIQYARNGASYTYYLFLDSNFTQPTKFSMYAQSEFKSVILVEDIFGGP